jgi:hypothetical protein
MNKEIEIESGIPIPAARSVRKYPWQEMKVGDSFFTTTNKIRSFRTMVSAASSRLGVKFRTAPEKGGMRVWRVN